MSELGDWGDEEAGRAGGQGDKKAFSQCSMPNTYLREAALTASLRDALTFAQYKCPMPHANAHTQCPIPREKYAKNTKKR
ncbi:hypothetical protein [Nostoc sp.]|uniref:hypothetical protein n=1 Tax=Nostoc sp. TaxID=1180 RepID=UPI002FFBFB1F